MNPEPTRPRSCRLAVITVGSRSVANEPGVFFYAKTVTDVSGVTGEVIPSEAARSRGISYHVARIAQPTHVQHSVLYIFGKGGFTNQRVVKPKWPDPKALEMGLRDVESGGGLLFGMPEVGGSKWLGRDSVAVALVRAECLLERIAAIVNDGSYVLEGIQKNPSESELSYTFKFRPR